ncbi:MAG TPA: CCE_0567 family metalloprotein [Lamprocystis sp. (in: g-proteobacteria)]|nr:CCE_0567 family metalloprotein [Lamprocystis sp. (in: g-proteobacteria)]
MNSEQITALDRAAKKAKRIASERAGELHDLVEDRLPAAYEEIPGIAQATYDACRSWAEAEARLKAALAAVTAAA